MTKKEQRNSLLSLHCTVIGFTRPALLVPLCALVFYHKIVRNVKPDFRLENLTFLCYNTSIVSCIKA